MELRTKGLNGYVEFTEGKITPHGDIETKYMQHLMKRAENIQRAWNEADKPEIEYLSSEARKIVENLQVHKFALDNFDLRLQKQIETGLDREHAIELWENLTKNREAAEYMFEQQMYRILKNV